MRIKVTNLDDLFFVITLIKYHEKYCIRMLLTCTPILNSQNIEIFLKFLKSRAVKHQDYETGVLMRNFERNEYTRFELLKFLREEYEKCEYEDYLKTNEK